MMDTGFPLLPKREREREGGRERERERERERGENEWCPLFDLFVIGCHLENRIADDSATTYSILLVLPLCIL